MNGYRIKKQNNKWQFILYPHNNCRRGKQEIGHSKDYNDYNECKNALTEFRNFLNENTLELFNSDFMQLCKIGNKYSVQYVKNDEVIFSTRPDGNKQNRDNGINSIYRLREEYTRNDLDD